MWERHFRVALIDILIPCCSYLKRGHSAWAVEQDGELELEHVKPPLIRRLLWGAQHNKVDTSQTAKVHHPQTFVFQQPWLWNWAGGYHNPRAVISQATGLCGYVSRCAVCVPGVYHALLRWLRVTLRSLLLVDTIAGP